MREQKGSIILRSGKWYVTWWERRNIAGSVDRKRVTHYLGEKITGGKYRPADIVAACKLHMATVNANTRAVKPEQVVAITDFVETIYLPWVREQKRASTQNGYQKMWDRHLHEHFGQTLLRDYTPGIATRFLTELAQRGMGMNAVGHVRALMSGIFKHAAALEYVNANPIHLAKILVTPRAPKETPHYTVLEMGCALAGLQDQPEARVAMALAFLGLRPSEIHGLRWEDVDPFAGVLHIRRSAWRKIINEGGKGKRSVRGVTLGPTVSGILEGYRQARRSPSGFVLENTAGNPLDLYKLAREIIRPALATMGIEWKGYYGGRRGAETEMNRYTNGNSQLTAHHFGHTKEVADSHYIKPLPDETRIAALALDAAIGDSAETRASGKSAVN
jgi:integrase